MSVQYREASKTDINTLIRLRLEYLIADRGCLTEKETEEISKQLMIYFEDGQS